MVGGRARRIFKNSLLSVASSDRFHLHPSPELSNLSPPWMGETKHWRLVWQCKENSNKTPPWISKPGLTNESWHSSSASSCSHNGGDSGACDVTRAQQRTHVYARNTWLHTYIYICRWRRTSASPKEKPRPWRRSKSIFYTTTTGWLHLSLPPSLPPPSSPVPPTPSQRFLACFVLSLATTTYIHPLKDHAQGWGLKSTRSKGCLRPDTLVTEPFFLSLFLSPPPPFFVLSLPPLPWGAIMTRSVVISGGRARLEKEGMERNLWNFMRPILPDQVWKCAFGDVGNVPASNWDHRVSPDADGYIPGDV